MFHRNLTGLDLHEPTNVLVENNTGGTLPLLKVVVLGAFGTTRPEVAIVSSSSEKRFGIVSNPILNADVGYVTTFGFLYNVNTNAWPVNTVLYSDNSGNLTTSINGSVVATVIKQNATTGILYVTTIGSDGGGGSGITSQLNWKFSTSIVAADPGAGYFRYNNAALASVTAIYINDLANSTVDIGTVLAALDIGDKFYIQQGDTTVNNALFTMSGPAVDNTGWWTIPVTVDDSGTLHGNNTDCGIIVLPVAGSSYTHPNHTGEVTSTGDGAQVVDKTAISNKTSVTAAATDTILIGDASDSNNLKKVTAQSIANLAPSYTHPNHTGEVTSIGDGAQTVDKTAITNKATVTPVAGDFFLFSDASDSGNLKKADFTTFATSLPILDTQVSIQKLGATTYDVLRDYINVQSSTGSITGGVITDGGTGTVDITAGSVYIRSTNSDLGELFTSDFSAVTGQALTDLVNNYIYVQYNAGVPNIVVSTSILADNNTNVILGIVYRSGTEVHITNVSAKTQQVATRVGKRLALVEGLTRQSGSITSGVGTRNIQISVGQWWLGLTEYTLSAINTSVSDTFKYFYRDGGSGFLEVTGQTQINNLQYDDGSGTLATLGNAKYGVHWVYRGVDNDTYVIYGRGSYSLTEAESAPQPDTLPGQMNGFHTALVAKIIIQKSAGAFTSVQNPFSSVFTQTTPTAHSDLSGLGWTTSGHTGAINTLAGFDGTALPIGYTLSGTGTQVALTNSPTFVTPALGTPSSGNLSNTTNYPSSNIDHDATTNFVANEHIDHSTTNINTAANSGLAGGGDTTTSRSLTLDVNNLPVDTIVGADSIPFYDASGADTNKTTVANFISAINSTLDHGTLAGLGDDDHTIYTKADGTRAFTGAQSMGGFKITNLADGSAASDAINKGQLDSALNGLKPKAAVRAASTATINLATDLENGDIQDGVTLATGDRFLVKDNGTASQNGIYIVQVSGAAVRATDFDSVSPIDEINGAMVPVEEGTANAGKIFVQSGAAVVTVGTDPINFVYFNSISNLVGAEGITISGINVSVDHDGEGLIFVGAGASAQLALELDGSTLSKSASGVKVATGGIANNEIASGAAIAVNKLAAMTALLPVITDASGFVSTTTYSTLSSNILHNSTSGYVANEHINHTSVSIATAAGTSGLAGGGDLTTTRNLSVDIVGLTTVTAAVGDLIMVADVSDSNNLKKVTVQTIVDLASGSGANTALSNLVTTAINQDLIFDKTNAIVKTKDNAAAASANLAVTTGDGTGFSSGSLAINTGATDSANSGNIDIASGSAASGTTGVMFARSGAKSGSQTGATGTAIFGSGDYASSSNSKSGDTIIKTGDKTGSGTAGTGDLLARSGNANTVNGATGTAIFKSGDQTGSGTATSGTVAIKSGDVSGGIKTSGTTTIDTGSSAAGSSGATIISTGSFANGFASGSLTARTGSGIGGSGFALFGSGALGGAVGTSPTGTVTVKSGDNSSSLSGGSGDTIIATGDKTVGTGNSGNILLSIGSATGTQGVFKFIKSGTTTTNGFVWTAIGTDGTGYWAAAASGSGDVVGPASAVNNNVAFFDGVTGKLIKDSGLTLSGSNTGDNSANSLYSGLVSNATHTGDATGATALTVVAINGTSMAGLATGILKNTTATGVPSIAIGTDLPSGYLASNLANGGFTPGSVLFAGAANISQNNAKFFWNDTDSRLFLGQDANTNVYTLNTGTSGQTVLSAEDASNNLFGQVIGRSGTSANQGGQATFYRSRGTTAAKTAVVTNDNLGRLLFTGFDGTDFARAARIDAVVTEATPGPGAMGTKLVFSTTPAGTEAVATAMEISSAQVVNFVNAPTGFNVEALSTALTAGSVVFSNGTNLTQDNTNFFFDNTNDQLAVGHNVTGALIVGGLNPTPRYIAYNENVLDQGFATIASENTNPASFNGLGIYRTRGTVGSPTSVLSGDVIGAVNWFGRDATDYQTVASILVSTVGTIGAGSIPSTMSISTSSGSATVNAITINQNQLTSILKGADISGGQLDIRPTSAIANNPYAFVIDCAATNLIPNPSFANNITDGWVASGTSTNTRDTTEKWIGDASLKIVSSTTLSGLTSSSIAISSNTNYVASCYVKGAVGGETFVISITGNVSGLVHSTGTAFTLLNYVNTEWSRVTFPWTSGASDTSCTVSVRSRQATAQTIYVDAVQFEAKTLPSDVLEVGIPSSFISGDLGQGYAWTGTANNSTSTRTAGAKYLAPMLGSRGSFLLRTDGSIGRALFDAKEIQPGDYSKSRHEPFFPFTFNGKMQTNVITSGISAGIVNIRNMSDGTALQVESEVAAADGMVLSFPSITSGSGMTVFGPADLTAMQAAGGKFFQFAGKGQNLEIYQWKVDAVQMGALAFQFNKNVNIFGGGSQISTVRTLAGQVVVTNASTVVTKAGGAFLTEFKRGQAIRIATDAGATTWVNYTIASVDSNTQITLTSGYQGAGAAVSRDYDGLNLQYSPPMINLEGAYGHHGASGVPVADYFYGVYASGGAGQLHVMRSAARGVAVTPTADHTGNGLVTARQVSVNSGLIFGVTTETTMISGYTINAYELTPGGAFRISFVGSALMDNTARTLTWRVKLGGTTILTSTAVQVGVVGTVPFRGVIDIYTPTTTSQTVSLSIVGKDQAAVTPGLTYSVNNLDTTGTVDMRLDQALTVTCQADAAGQVIAVSGVTTEII